MPVIEAQYASILVPHDHRHINHERALGFNSGWRHEPSGVLRCHRGLELDYEFGGNPAAVFDLDPLGLGPLSHFGGVQTRFRE
jgi:hypothetical protein